MKAPRGDAGFSLLEVLLAVAVLSIGLVAVLILFRYHLREADGIIARREALAEIRMHLVQSDPLASGAASMSLVPSATDSASGAVEDMGPWSPIQAYPGTPARLDLVVLQQPWEGGGRHGMVEVQTVARSEP